MSAFPILDSISKILRDSQRKLNSYLSRTAFANLETVNGKLTSSDYNRKQISGFTSFINDFSSRLWDSLRPAITRGIRQLQDEQKQYFQTVKREPVSIGNASKAAEKRISEVLGVSPDGLLLPKGVMIEVLRDGSIADRIRRDARIAVRKGESMAAFTDRMTKLIEGDETTSGILTGRLETNLHDVISKTERLIANIYAEELGLNFAIYAGGLIKTSREFCILHNGNVYHRSEIAKFDPHESVPDVYNPFIDMGGYNCRHYYNWVSDEIAVSLRPDAAQFIRKVPA